MPALFIALLAPSFIPFPFANIIARLLFYTPNPLLAKPIKAIKRR
jgi:hypothetical protein